ncbi:MAG: aminopeptidase [Spirochaetaceae bacterium]|nr:aminopeptidase [Spirochaetaceae bacterium]
MTQTQLDRYAELLIWCIGGVDDRKILVRAEPVHREFAVQVARKAYRQGAALVTIDYAEPLLVRARVELAEGSGLALHPDFQAVRAVEYAGEEWSLVRIFGSEEPDYLLGLDPDRIAVYAKSARKIDMPLLDTVTRFRKHWVGGLYPTRALARRAFPDLDEGAALSRYEDEVVRILGLDEDNPVGLWRERFAELSSRRDAYNQLALDSLHLTGPGTDLEIGLLPGGRWATAEAVMPDGRTVYVNIPSLEIFTSPDLRRTSGRVASTRPYLSSSSPGTLIRGAWFEFEDGAVVKFGADEGEDVLAAVLEMDEQAKYLGEIALVDSQSAVARAGCTFFNTLYDENAAIHMAFGRGFPRFIDGADGLTAAQLVAAGVNQSLVHDDVMIGSEAVDVDGQTTSGDVVPLMRSGRFVE